MLVASINRFNTRAGVSQSQSVSFRAVTYDRAMIDKVAHSLKVRRLPEETIEGIKDAYSDLTLFMANADRGLGSTDSFNRRLDSGFSNYSRGRAVKSTKNMIIIAERLKEMQRKAEFERDKILSFAQIVGPGGRIAFFDSRTLPPYAVKIGSTLVTFAKDGLYSLQR